MLSRSLFVKTLNLFSLLLMIGVLSSCSFIEKSTPTPDDSVKSEQTELSDAEPESPAEEELPSIITTEASPVGDVQSICIEIQAESYHKKYIELVDIHGTYFRAILQEDNTVELIPVEIGMQGLRLGLFYDSYVTELLTDSVELENESFGVPVGNINKLLLLLQGDEVLINSAVEPEYLIESTAAGLKILGDTIIVRGINPDFTITISNTTEVYNAIEGFGELSKVETSKPKAVYVDPRAIYHVDDIKKSYASAAIALENQERFALLHTVHRDQFRINTEIIKNTGSQYLVFNTKEDFSDPRATLIVFQHDQIMQTAMLTASNDTLEDVKYGTFFGRQLKWFVSAMYYNTLMTDGVNWDMYDDVTLSSQFINQEGMTKIVFELTPRKAQNLLTNIQLTLLARSLTEMKGNEHLNEDSFFRDANSFINDFANNLYIEDNMLIEAYISKEGILTYSRWTYNDITEEFYLERQGVHNLDDVDTQPWWTSEIIENFVQDKNKQYSLLNLPSVYFEYPRVSMPAIDLDNSRGTD